MVPGCLSSRAVSLLIPGFSQASWGHSVLTLWDLGLSLSPVPRVSFVGCGAEFGRDCCKSMGCGADLSRSWCLLFPQDVFWHLCGP